MIMCNRNNKSEMRKQTLWMVIAILICGPILTSCIDYLEDNPSGSSESGNIIEPSAFADLMYPNIYVGDDFYDYAVGRWLDEHPLKKGEFSNGTIAAVEDVRNEFIKKLSGKDYGVKTGIDEVITALHDDYSATEYADDKAVLKTKLANIDEAATKDALYEQMGLLVKDGYQMPFEYICRPIERRVTPALDFPVSIQELDASAEELIQLADMTAEEAKSTMKMAEDWKSFLIDQEISSKAAASNRTGSREARLEKVNLRSGTRGAGTAPLQAILKAAGIDNEKDLVADKHFASVEDYLDACTLDQLKMLCKYLVVNRDFDYIPSDPTDKKQKVRGAEDVIAALCKNIFSPIAVNVSAVFDQAIPAANREAVMKMAEEIRASFKERINSRQWLSAATKAKAIEKLEAMTFYVGWPANDSGRKNWLVKVPENRKSLYQDILDLFRQRTALVEQMKGKEGEADLFYAEQWSDPSYKNNARYFIINNSMHMLSINLISPVFDLQMIDAMKYGMLGTVIGHELTHGFDNVGSFYNEIGKKEEWWIPADRQNYVKLQDAMVKNFNSLYYADNVFCDGEATLAENIADLGGLYISYDAFAKKMKETGISGDELDRQGREFFRALAYYWMENMSEACIENYKYDEHAANCLRVNGNVYLVDEFYRLFNIQGGKMYLDPKYRIEIW